MHSTVLTLRTIAQSLAAFFLILAASKLHAAEERTLTVVFFADHAMNEEQWSSLFADIQSEMHAPSSEASDSAVPSEETRFDLLRGDHVQPGLAVDSSISVYLHGDCAPLPQSLSHAGQSSQHPGALGWVERAGNKITPFIHIDCALISHVLRSSALFLSADRKDLVSNAIARVFLHEWLHIETQSSHHTHTGIAKSAFTASDLAGQGQAAYPHRRQRVEGPSLLSPAHGK